MQPTYFMQDQTNTKDKLNKLWNSPFCEFWQWVDGVVMTGRDFLDGKAKPAVKFQ